MESRDITSIESDSIFTNKTRKKKNFSNRDVTNFQSLSSQQLHIRQFLFSFLIFPDDTIIFPQHQPTRSKKKLHVILNILNKY